MHRSQSQRCCTPSIRAAKKTQSKKTQSGAVNATKLVPYWPKHNSNPRNRSWKVNKSNSYKDKSLDSKNPVSSKTLDHRKKNLTRNAKIPISPKFPNKKTPNKQQKSNAFFRKLRINQRMQYEHSQTMNPNYNFTNLIPSDLDANRSLVNGKYISKQNTSNINTLYNQRYENVSLINTAYKKFTGLKKGNAFYKNLHLPTLGNKNFTNEDVLNDCNSRNTGESYSDNSYTMYMSRFTRK